VPHGAALGASGPSPGRTTRRQLVVARSGAGSLHGPRWAGRYPPPPPLFPLLLRQPATAKLSTRTSRTAVTTNRMRLMAHLLVPISISVPENQEHPNYSPHPPSAAALALPGAMAQPLGPFLERSGGPEGSAPYSSGGRAVALCRALCPPSCTGSLQSWINPDDQVHRAPAEQGGCASYGSFRTVPDDWHRLKNRKVGGSIPSLPTRLPRSAAYAMRLPTGQSPGLRHRRAPGHASNHGEEPDDGSYRSSGQVLITRAAAAVARRRDPTNPAPAQPPGAGGAGAGGAPQDWGRGARSRDTVRLRAP
jgi:hypothetical protein